MSDKVVGQTAAVVGGGVGGLAVANLLAKQGYEVTVYEKNDQLGGRMGILRQDGFRFDTGPSWYLMPEVFEHYFDLLGHKTTDYYELQKLQPGYKVFFDYAKPLTVRGDLEKDAATFESLEVGAGRELKKYVADARTIYQLALQNFLYNPFRSFGSLARDTEVLRHSPALLRGLTGSLHGHVKRSFERTELQQILEYAMVFLGTSPFTAPSMYRLMSYLDFEQGVFFPKGGMYKVAEALVVVGKDLRVQYKTGVEVSEIVVQNGAATGVRVNGQVQPADIVISNADLAFTETQLLPAKYQTYPQSYWSKKKAAPAALLMYLSVKGSLPHLEHHNLLFVKDWRKNFSDIYDDKNWPEPASMYVSRTSATDPSTALKGHENIFVLVPLPPGKQLSATEQAKLADRYIAQIADQMDIPDLAERIVSKSFRGPADFTELFNAWQGSALGLNHIMRQSAFMRPQVRSKKVSNLYYVGAMTQPGIGVPMCLISAELVIKDLAGDTSAGPLNRLPELR